MSTVVKERIVLKYINQKPFFENKNYVGYNGVAFPGHRYVHATEVGCMTFGSVAMAKEEQTYIGEPTEIKFLRYTIEEVKEINIFSDR